MIRDYLLSLLRSSARENVDSFLDTKDKIARRIEELTHKLLNRCFDKIAKNSIYTRDYLVRIKNDKRPANFWFLVEIARACGYEVEINLKEK